MRCKNKKHAELVAGAIEIRCGSAFCGKMPGVVVLHRFDPRTGDLLETKKFQDPIPERGE